VNEVGQEIKGIEKMKISVTKVAKEEGLAEALNK